MTQKYDTLIYEVTEPRIAQITINQPETMNGYSDHMCVELFSAIDRYWDDDELRCLILTGSGRAFCAGGNIKPSPTNQPYFRGRQMGHAQQMRTRMHRVVEILHRMDKPVIAMVNGVAVAGGLNLALACDIRIAAESARLGDTAGKFALLPDEGGCWFFPRFMGLDHALKMSWLHEVYTAAQALEFGLVTEVVPDTKLKERTYELARSITKKGPLAVRLVKTMMRKGMSSSLEHSLEDAALSVCIGNKAQDVEEGRAAFFGKREPNFQGR